MRMLWIDPGKMSGWFVIDFATGDWAGGEMAHDAFLDWLDPYLVSGTSPLTYWQLDRVGMEGFRIGPKTYQHCSSDESAWSIKQIGAVQMWCRRIGMPFDRQMPLNRDNWDGQAGSDKLKKVGWYKAMPGVKGEAGHRRAAAKHALKWAIDHRLIDAGVLL